jgi:ketosteroid isomerase-like protein
MPVAGYAGAPSSGKPTWLPYAIVGGIGFLVVAGLLITATSGGVSRAQVAQPMVAAAPGPEAPEQPVALTPTEEILVVVETWRSSYESGDLDAHMACYADPIATYHGKTNVSNAYVRKGKAPTLNDSGGSRTQTVSAQDVTPSGDTAVAMLDKEWNYTSSAGKVFAGKVRSRLSLAKTAAGWKIVGEKDVKIYWVRK